LAAVVAFADALALSAAPPPPEPRAHREFLRIDLVQHVHQILEDRVDLGADVARLQHLAAGEPLRARVVRIDQVDVLGAERGGRLDLRAHVGGDVLDLVAVDVQLQPDAGGRPALALIAATWPTLDNRASSPLRRCTSPDPLDQRSA